MDSSTISLSRAELENLGEQIAEHGAHLDAATHRLLADLRRFDRAGGWTHQGAKSCAHWLSWRLGWSGNRAREHVRVAGRLGELPLIDDALRRGEVSYCKVRAMTRVATPANEAVLLEDARHSTGNQLETICRKYAMVQRADRPSRADDVSRRTITRRDLEDGMVGLHVTVHPEEAAMIWEALSAIARERATTKGFDRVDALVEVCEGVFRGSTPERSPIELVVTVAEDVLDGTADVAQVAVAADGTCVSAETARRLACDCTVVEARESASGSNVFAGRARRTINAALRRALLDRDKTCRFPGCTNRQFVHGHHIKHWAHGGPTQLDNMVSLCSFHHRFVHEYGYRIELDELQQPWFFDPRGRPVVEVPAPIPTHGMRGVRAANSALAITPSTNEPRWDGDAVDYSLVIDGLLQSERRVVH